MDRSFAQRLRNRQGSQLRRIYKYDLLSFDFLHKLSERLNIKSLEFDKYDHDDFLFKRKDVSAYIHGISIRIDPDA
jgi:hypothetical protein